eukprot:CAMPEP_0116936608 /NCGR_PEP_ID=MMETSP0467-20121206/30994_1 /TAXON_ID=283647 /ORGANISM="Mesodinium pulex, Strain SPMC105" /LENGTH=194 /DNA_ID=CAMNT_0004618233 /DNA_START=53 /DNA_END=637 /DNA_ORIENTATION=+
MAIIENFVIDIGKIDIVRVVFLPLDHDQLAPTDDPADQEDEPGVAREELAYDGCAQPPYASHDVAHPEDEALDVPVELLVGKNKQNREHARTREYEDKDTQLLNHCDVHRVEDDRPADEREDKQSAGFLVAHQRYQHPCTAVAEQLPHPRDDDVLLHVEPKLLALLKHEEETENYVHPERGQQQRVQLKATGLI